MMQINLMDFNMQSFLWIHYKFSLCFFNVLKSILNKFFFSCPIFIPFNLSLLPYFRHLPLLFLCLVRLRQGGRPFAWGQTGAFWEMEEGGDKEAVMMKRGRDGQEEGHS